MQKVDKQTLDIATDEVQKLIDENYPCDNADQKIGYQLALYKVYNLLSSIRIKIN